MKHISIVLVSIFMLSGCENALMPSPAFHKGQIIKSVIDGQRGQIIKVKCWAGKSICRYSVRFKSIQGDEWGRAYTSILMTEFELEKVR